MGIVHPVNLTRFFYHISYGAFSVRDSSDNISVSDEIVNGVAVRIFRPHLLSKSSNAGGVNSGEEVELRPTIFFYHGGGYFVGTAG